ncbi:MAG: hypothetical protein HWE09_08325 [Cyclobacteriaceae bacterium]|nr:hypothetical protein [Cyclobacteriaceae bacterium]
MKKLLTTLRLKTPYYTLSLLGFLVFKTSNVRAQDAVSAELKALVSLDMDHAQEKLESLGYEICGVKPFGHSEDWINQSAKTCITIKFDKKTEKITEISSNSNYSACLKGLENVRKLWENYHDGQAPAGDAKVNEERKKLESEGFKVSYWVNDVAPGRTAEYWVNESSKKVKSIVWDTQGGKWAMTHDSDYSMAKNPSPIKN